MSKKSFGIATKILRKDGRLTGSSRSWNKGCMTVIEPPVLPVGVDIPGGGAASIHRLDKATLAGERALKSFDFTKCVNGAVRVVQRFI